MALRMREVLVRPLDGVCAPLALRLSSPLISSFLFIEQTSEVVDPSSNSTAVVLITVLDKNDNPPKFLKDSYHFTIREDLALPGYMVTDQLNVQDKDINVSIK